MTLEQLGEARYLGRPEAIDAACCPVCGRSARGCCASCIEQADAMLDAAVVRLSGSFSPGRAWAFGLLATVPAAACWLGATLLLGVESALCGLAMAWIVALAVLTGTRGVRGPRVQRISLVCGALSVLLALVVQNLALWARLVDTRAVPWTSPVVRLERVCLGLLQTISLKGMVFWGLVVLCGVITWRIPQAPPPRKSNPTEGRVE